MNIRHIIAFLCSMCMPLQSFFDYDSSNKKPPSCKKIAIEEKAEQYIPKKPSGTLSKDFKKINDDLYVSTKNGLHFALERVTKENWFFWAQYITKQGDKVRSLKSTLSPEIEKGYSVTLRPFKMALGSYEKDDVWIAFVTEKSITDISTKFNLQHENDIVMSVTVSANKNVPFTTHLGIFRAVEFSSKKTTGLVINLHSFAATLTKYLYEPSYMITRPVTYMKNLMFNNIPKNMIWIGKTEEINDILQRKKFFETNKDLSSTNINTFCSIFDEYSTCKKLIFVEKIIKDVDNYYTKFVNNQFYELKTLDSSIEDELKKTIQTSLENSKGEKIAKQEWLEKLKEIILEYKKNLNQNFIDSKVHFEKVYKINLPFGDDTPLMPILINQNCMILPINNKKITLKTPAFIDVLLNDAKGAPFVVINNNALADLWNK